jgi:hypothetical protein
MLPSNTRRAEVRKQQIWNNKREYKDKDKEENLKATVGEPNGDIPGEKDRG